jgi:radical SAM superfamily enzyme YgiQ (UPF0313 family)
MKKATTHQFPLGLGYLAAVLQSANIEVKIVDLRYDVKKEFNALLTSFSPDIVGISCMTQNHREAFKVARYVKSKSDALVVLGGVHATFMYEEILLSQKEIDILVIGEGENTLLELCQWVKNNKLYEDLKNIQGIAFRDGDGIYRTPDRLKIEELDGLPTPAFDCATLPTIEEYLKISRTLPILTSRGCPYNCAFCSTSVMHGRQYRTRTPEKIIEEIEFLKNTYNVSSFYFVDDTFTVNKERAKKICLELLIRNLDISWGCSARVDTLTPDLIKLMKSSGCNTIFFGIESLNDDILRKIKKGFTTKQVVNSVKLALDEGIVIDTSFILGIPGDELHSGIRIQKFVKKYKINGRVLTNTLQILPGTDMYIHPEKYGIEMPANYNSSWVKPRSFTRELPFKKLLKDKIKIQVAAYEARNEDCRLYEVPYPHIKYNMKDLPTIQI